MTSATATTEAISAIEADAIIVGIGADGKVADHPQLSAVVRESLDSAFVALEASGKLGSTSVVPGVSSVKATRVVGVGIGDGDTNALREAAGAASRACGKKPTKVVVALPIADESDAAAVTHG